MTMIKRNRDYGERRNAEGVDERQQRPGGNNCRDERPEKDRYHVVQNWNQMIL